MGLLHAAASTVTSQKFVHPLVDCRLSIVVKICFWYSFIVCYGILHIESWTVMTEPSHQYPAPTTTVGPVPSVITVDKLPRHGLLPSQYLSSASSYADLQYLFGVQDPAMLAPKPENPAKSNNRRRKSNQDPQRTKHRRTRSGCYTCRSRRVKV